MVADPTPSAVRSKFARRMQRLFFAVSLLSGAYALSWTPGSTSPAVLERLGPFANNCIMLLVFLPAMVLLAMAFPDDLDSRGARQCIGPLVVASDASGVHVFYSVMKGYADDRAAEASTDINRWMCLHVHYALCVFFCYWGVIYPTLCFLRIGGCQNSWAVLRRGLVTDAIVFYSAIALLYYFGETRYPPGDVPLMVALLGRPAIALCSATIFTPTVRNAISEFGVALGVFHISLDLNELQRHEIRRLLGHCGLGVPVASGNAGSIPDQNAGDNASLQSSSVQSKPRHQSPGTMPGSHHTAKLGSMQYPMLEEAQALNASQSGGATRSAERSGSLVRRRQPEQPSAQ